MKVMISMEPKKWGATIRGCTIFRGNMVICTIFIISTDINIQLTTVNRQSIDTKNILNL